MHNMMRNPEHLYTLTHFKSDFCFVKNHDANGYQNMELKIDRDCLAEVRSAFYAYVDNFKDRTRGMHPLLQLKIDHSERVADECKALAHDLGWSSAEEVLAGILGILHDIGRFPQFHEYRTFSDKISVNHGEEGWRVVRAEGMLDSIPTDQADALLTAVRYHNVRVIPDNIEKQSLPWLQLIRDADKLDILGIVLAAVEKDGFTDLKDMLPDISLDRTPSDHIVAEIRDHQNVNLQNVTNIGDFLLLQMSWIYDFNYRPSLRRISERQILDQIERLVERTTQVDSLLEDLRQFLEASADIQRSEPLSRASSSPYKSKS